MASYPVEAIAEALYHALVAAEHAGYCPARHSRLYDEERRVWGPPDPARHCECGRDAALARYEARREAAVR